jgi:ABC-2 type transport system ATP-binding protein
MTPAIRVEGLRMRYGDVEAVRGIDLEVARGEIFCFLGPNGAGKTTTVEILEGYRRRTGGAVEVLGVDPARGDADWRGRIGVVLQDCTPEAELTTAETVAMYAGFHDAPLAVDHVLELVGLREHARTRNARLSGGQQRRLDFALALVGDPDLIFLDEPTTGFDPAARRAAWDVIAGLRAMDKTVFLTTHYLDEAEALADRIAVIAGGCIVASGTPATLADRHRAPTEIRVRGVADRSGLPSSLARRVQLDGSSLVLQTTKALRDLHTLTGWLLDRDDPRIELDVRQPSLEDVYLQLVSEGAVR